MSESKTIRNYNYPAYDDLEDFDAPIRLPKQLPPQECLRCGNQFPGGLKRCTACGLDATRAFIKPEIARPWPGFERGVIECSSCGYSTPDDLARRGRIQKCRQCAKVLYIPSGLYRITPPNALSVNTYQPSQASVWWWLGDRIGAMLSRLARSKARIPIAIVIVLLGVGFIFGLNFFKTQTQSPVVEVTSPLKLHYEQALKMSKELKIAEGQFDLGAGGAPLVGDFNDKVSPANKARFVRACDRMVKQVESDLTKVYAMAGSVPAGAESHYAKLKTKLEEQQRYYARLKDGVEQKDEARWKEAFAGLPIMKDSNAKEEQALNQMQASVMNQAQATPKA